MNLKDKKLSRMRKLARLEKSTRWYLMESPIASYRKTNRFSIAGKKSSGRRVSFHWLSVDVPRYRDVAQLPGFFRTFSEVSIAYKNKAGQDDA